MKLKLKHLSHPFRTATVAKDLIAARLNMMRCADSGERRFQDDPRYALESVTDGFASRLNEQHRTAEPDDAALLERICTAYIKATEREPLTSPAYRATPWWERVRRENLEPVMRALRTRDITSLNSIYRNFLRDPCSAGLIGLPWSGTSFGNVANSLYQRFYLADVLYRLDCWAAQTQGRFHLSDLSGPPIGNPFGALIQGTLIRAGTEYHHYCAHRIIDLLPTLPHSARATVAEIGGGFGDMAYYLLRDCPHITYLNFDIPETIALASYYLMKSFPQLKFLLFGEEDLTPSAITHANVVLMPAFELPAVAASSADLTFCSHLMSDMPPAAVAEYLHQVARITRDHFFFVGSTRAHDSIHNLLGHAGRPFALAFTQPSGWHTHRAAKWNEVESLYRAFSITGARTEPEALVET